ncbi:hypothetical protein RFI_26958, partial [Reticulomyxa filosa]
MFNENASSSVQREFQKGLDVEERRREREEERLLLRKRQRSQILKKRRVSLQTHEGHEETEKLHQLDKFSMQLRRQEKIKNLFVLHFEKKKLEQLGELVKGCHENHEKTNYECCKRIRQLLSVDKKPPIDKVIDSGIVPRLVDSTLRLQFFFFFNKKNDIHMCLFVRVYSNFIEFFFYGIPAFVRLLETTKNEEIFEQSLWALGNISGENAKCRDLVLAAGGLDKLIPRLEGLNNVTNRKQLSLLRTACWALSNYCRGKPAPPRVVIEKCLPALMPFLMSTDGDILQDASWAFSYLTDNDDDDDDSNNNNNNNGENGNSSNEGKEDRVRSDSTDLERIELIQKSGVLIKLVNLLEHPSPFVQHPVLRCIGNMITGTPTQTQVILKKLFVSVFVV